TGAREGPATASGARHLPAQPKAVAIYPSLQVEASGKPLARPIKPRKLKSFLTMRHSGNTTPDHVERKNRESNPEKHPKPLFGYLMQDIGADPSSSNPGQDHRRNQRQPGGEGKARKRKGNCLDQMLQAHHRRRGRLQAQTV